MSPGVVTDTLSYIATVIIFTVGIACVELGASAQINKVEVINGGIVQPTSFATTGAGMRRFTSSSTAISEVYV